MSVDDDLLKRVVPVDQSFDNNYAGMLKKFFSLCDVNSLALAIVNEFVENVELSLVLWH